MSAIELGDMNPLGALSVFARAAEARSFTAAGRQLGVSSSAIGKGIARLEERLGVRLFHRSTRTITLTREGALFLERCRRIFAEVEAAEQELAQTQTSPRGKLRVSVPLAGALLMPALTAFMRAFPAIELEVDFTDRLVDVIEEGFDAVVRGGEVRDSRLMARALGTYRLMLVGAPEYLARRGTPQSPEDLKSHACLLHRFPSTGLFERWPLRRGRRNIEMDLPAAAIVNTIEPLIYLAEQGVGIACLPDFAIRRQLEVGALVRVLERHTHHIGTFRLLWPSSKFLSLRLRVFVDFMAKTLARG